MFSYLQLKYLITKYKTYDLFRYTKTIPIFR